MVPRPASRHVPSVPPHAKSPLGMVAADSPSFTLKRSRRDAQPGAIGLGQMGGNMVRRLMRGGQACAVFDLNAQMVKQCERDRASGADSLNMSYFESSRCPVPYGSCSHRAQQRMRRQPPWPEEGTRTASSLMAETRILRILFGRPKPSLHYVDVGTSGGVWGVKCGYCLTAGGEQAPSPAARPYLPYPRPRQGGHSRNAGPSADERHG